MIIIDKPLCIVTEEDPLHLLDLKEDCTFRIEIKNSQDSEEEAGPNQNQNHQIKEIKETKVLSFKIKNCKVQTNKNLNET